MLWRGALLYNITGESPHSPDKSPPATPTAWASDKPKKRPEYYETVKEKYKEFIDGIGLLSIPSILKTVVTRAISLLTSDVKSRKLIGVSREIMEEAFKSQYSAKSAGQEIQRYVGYPAGNAERSQKSSR